MAESGEQVSVEISEEHKLPELFKEIWNVYDILEKTEESTSSDKNQGYVHHACGLCKTAIDMVNKLQLFSGNEDIEEVSTNELKYILLPALHGYFLMKCTVRNRLKVVKESQDFFIDYLRMCKSYNVTNIEVPARIEPELAEQQAPATNRPNPADIRTRSYTRSSKIQRYKEQKELDKKLEELLGQVEKEHVDDEVKRDYYSSLLKKWVNISAEEIDSINSEITILEMMEQRKANGETKEIDKRKTEQRPGAFRPFIITKDMLQKQVYGLGYPGIPTVTVEEFMDEKIAMGQLNIPGHGAGGHSMQDWAMDPDQDKVEREKEEAEKEGRLDRDDPDERRKIAEWDEYKDEHRRGWGNRKNMG